MTPEGLDKLAFETFLEFHRKLGHSKYCDREVFDELPARKQAWICIVQVFLENKIRPGRWLDDYAFEMFNEVHGRLGDGQLTRLAFDRDTYRRPAWYEIVRALETLRAKL